MKFGDALQLLELTPPVTREQIKKQYRKMSKRYSPDLTQSSNTEPLFRLVIEAYKLLWEGFDVFFSGKAFMPPPKATSSQTQSAPSPPPPKTNVKTRRDPSSGNLWVETESGVKLEIERFSNGKSIRTLSLPKAFYHFDLRMRYQAPDYREVRKDLLDYLDSSRDEYEWFARIYGCRDIERQMLLDCGFHPLFPQDNPPSLTYLHRDIL